MASEPELLPFGRFGRPHGVRGEISLHVFNASGDTLDAAELPLPVTVVRGERREPATVTAVRRAGDSYLVRIEGASSREAVAAFTNAELWLPRAALPALEPGEFFIADLVGCEAFDVEGKRRGVVREVFWNGAQDVITIDGGDGQELIVPAVDDFIVEVDLEARRLVVDPHE